MRTRKPVKAKPVKAKPVKAKPVKAKPVKATAAAGAQLDDRKPAHASTRSWERSLAYRILNADKIAERSRLYRILNADKIAERSRLYRAANRNILTPKQIAAALARVGR